MKREQDSREQGSFLLELAIALAILTIGLLGFFTAFHSNLRAGGTTELRDEVRLAFENVTETLRSAPFETLYANYDGVTIQVPHLLAPDGGLAEVAVACVVNETAIPAAFGPLADLDGNPAANQTDCSTTYKLLPVRLSLSYLDVDHVEFRDLFIVIGPGA